MRCMTEPEETWTSLQTAAIAMHELFDTLTNSGFTEDQALTLMAKMVTESEGLCD